MYAYICMYCPTHACCLLSPPPSVLHACWCAYLSSTSPCGTSPPVPVNALSLRSNLRNPGNADRLWWQCTARATATGASASKLFRSGHMTCGKCCCTVGPWDAATQVNVWWNVRIASKAQPRPQSRPPSSQLLADNHQARSLTQGPAPSTRCHLKQSHCCVPTSSSSTQYEATYLSKLVLTGPDSLFPLRSRSRKTGLLLLSVGTLPLSWLLLKSSASVGSASQLAGMLPVSWLLPRATCDILLLPAGSGSVLM